MTEKHPPMDIELIASSDDYGENDHRWITQVGQLLDDLQRSGAGTVRKEVTPQAGRKGGAEAIILALGSAGAITATVELFKAWLSRDRSRSLTLKIQRGDTTEEITVAGQGMDAATVRTFMEKAVTRAAEGA